MASAAKRAWAPYTYRDLQEIADDRNRYELIEGEIYVSPSPTPWHQKVSQRLEFALLSTLEMRPRPLAHVFAAPVDVIFEDTTVLVPDIVVVRRRRRKLITKRAIEGAPDLIVEVLSPSTRRVDLAVKHATYAEWRVPEYWIVDPEAGTVELHRLHAGEYRLHARFSRRGTLRSVEFPELSVKLAPIFAPL